MTEQVFSKADDVGKQTFTAKQNEAFASTARFLLFGGGAGGGKTLWAEYDALGLNNPGDGKRAIDYPDYTALFLRRTLPQLRQVIDDTKKIYPVWGRGPNGEEPQWYEQKKMWVFPSGARIFFGFVDRPSDVYNYQGWEYQWICFEELTQWPSSWPFLYLHTRLRRVEGMPVQIGMKATCNPGGVGHHWVRSFWNIDDAGSPTHFSVPLEIELEDGHKEVVDLDRQFIPAKLDDNPFLSRAEYAAALEDPTQSAAMRRALRDGRWDVIDVQGVIYGDQIQELHNRGHIKEVPYDPRYPVNTFWDIGTTDDTAVWFHQRIGGVDYFIDYYQARHVGLKDHWRVLQEKGYAYGCHFVPHDAGHRRHNAGGVIMTIQNIMENLGMRNIELVPRTFMLRQAIEQVRVVLPKCVFDWSGCELGLQCLTNYRFKVGDDGQISAKPVHDEYSHGSDAFRQFAQAFDLIEDALDAHREPDDDADEVVPWSRAAAMQPARRRWIV